MYRRGQWGRCITIFDCRILVFKASPSTRTETPGLATCLTITNDEQGRFCDDGHAIGFRSATLFIPDEGGMKIFELGLEPEDASKNLAFKRMKHTVRYRHSNLK